MPAKFITVDSIDALNALFEESHRRTVVLFKHSNTCGISADIIDQVGNVDADVNVIVVQQHRDISDEVAARTGYRHHSPQAFVIRDGKAVYHATHTALRPMASKPSLDPELAFLCSFASLREKKGAAKTRRKIGPPDRAKI